MDRILYAALASMGGVIIGTGISIVLIWKGSRKIWKRKIAIG